MIINGLGTIIFSFLLGKKVGEDDRGNRYFVSKKKPIKKWVLYKNKVDPTNLPADWQMWLTNEQEIVPKDNSKKFHWQKDREPNLTGTSKAYHPAIKSPNSIEDKGKEHNNKIWSPH
ncbi:MAG: NADH-ubiquinone oxidoreductase [Rickettsiales bacterium]|nr:NADH-ubiquinone oxidoreductase [Rickettsiales bacterium]